MELHALLRQRHVPHPHHHVAAGVGGGDHQLVGERERRERVVAHRREQLRQPLEHPVAVVPDPLDDAVRGRDPVHGAAVRRHQALHPEADPQHRPRAGQQHLTPDREVCVSDTGVPGPGDSTTCECRSTSSGSTSSCWTTVGSTPVTDATRWTRFHV